MRDRNDGGPTVEEVFRVACALAFVVAIAATIIVILLRVA